MKYSTSKHKTGFNFRRHIVEASTTFVGDGTHYNNGKTGLLHFLTYTHIYTHTYISPIQVYIHTYIHTYIHKENQLSISII